MSNIKKIIVWVGNGVGKQVRPTWNYEFEYDFRNKNSTILTNDGWTGASWLSFDANWIYRSSWWDIFKQIWTDLTNAKKIQLTGWLYDANSFISWIWFYPSTNSTTGRSGVYIAWSWYGNSSVDINSSSAVSWVWAYSSGQLERNLTLDFDYLTYNLTYPWTTKSWTLTQAEANVIRWLKYFRIASQYTWWRIQYIKLKVQ